jgi:hypothetical protein
MDRLHPRVVLSLRTLRRGTTHWDVLPLWGGASEITGHALRVGPPKSDTEEGWGGGKDFWQGVITEERLL